jgi:hypothetical protein
LSYLETSLVRDRAFGSTEREEQAILDALGTLFLTLTVDYGTYREHIPRFLGLSELTAPKSIAYLLKQYVERYGQILRLPIAPFDDSIVNTALDSSAVDKVFECFETQVPAGSELGISLLKVDLSCVSVSEANHFLSFVLRLMKDGGEARFWDERSINTSILTLALARNVAEKTGDTELFYLFLGMFVERMNRAGNYQFVRDICEEFLITAFTHEMPEYGFYLSFRAYSQQGNFINSLIYANFCFTCLIKNGKTINEKLAKELVWAGVKLFRNVDLFSLSEQIYEQIPATLKFEQLEKRALDHTYLFLLLKQMKPRFLTKLENYLNEHREEIISGGSSECLPWLAMLYNSRRIYDGKGYEEHQLDLYESLFEKIVPPETSKRQKDIIIGGTGELKDHFKRMLVKLTATRYKSDFTHDVAIAITMANRLVEYAYNNRDIEAFLLAMMVKSDYSLAFSEKEADYLVPVHLTTAEVEEFIDYYQEPPVSARKLLSDEDDSIIWIASCENATYQAVLHKQLYKLSLLNGFRYSDFRKWTKSGFSDLAFDDRVVDKRGVSWPVTEEELKNQSEKLRNDLSFATIHEGGSARVLLIKDIRLSQFPHNLLLDEDGRFVFLKKPIANVLSVEWFGKFIDRDLFLQPSYSKEIWMPTMSGDVPLNLLYSKIEDVLLKNTFGIHTEAVIEKPLSSDLNILAAHGNEDISNFYAFYTNQTEVIHKIGKIIGRGKVLVLLICHSGSMKNAVFDNRSSSLVRYFLENGYQTVIAPFWSLHIEIPRIWLPEFLIGIERRESVLDAFYYANKCVEKTYPTPAAWGCLHLYGNPYLRVGDAE